MLAFHDILVFPYLLMSCRERMHRIIPDLITSGSFESAFDDVNFHDPDFLYIQCKFLYILNGIKPRLAIPYISETGPCNIKLCTCDF
jgi:hypothetical protein